MSSGRRNKLTGQIGEFLVCAELGVQGMIATPFAGNVPAFDVLAADEAGRTVPIQVKSSRSAQWPADASQWLKLRVRNGQQQKLGLQEISHPALIYVFVAIRDDRQEGIHDRFFILTKKRLQALIDVGYTHYMEERAWCRPRNPRSFDYRITPDQLAEFENDWALVSQQMNKQEPFTENL